MSDRVTALRFPRSYELKRNVADKNANPWKSDHFRNLPIAPVYMFPDKATFDSKEVNDLCHAVLVERPHLPHADVIFEVAETGKNGNSFIVYAMEREARIDAFLFIQQSDNVRRIDVFCHATYQPDGSASAEAYPGLDVSDAEACFEVLNGTLWRSIALLQVNTATREEHVSHLRRGMLRKNGVSGWSYRVATIDLQQIRARREPAQGTHAPPRWHIRRGHWRQLQDGRRVFVRECEVGDQARGGVVKDYRMDLGRAA